MAGFAGQNKPVLAKIVQIVGTCVNVAQAGMAELPNRRLAAGVTMGGGRPTRRAAGGAWLREQRFMVNFSYRVAGAESAAEDGLADAVDLFTDAVIADPTFGGLVHNAEVDNSLADNPDYSIWTNQERRNYPVLVTVTQSAQIPI